MLNRIAVVLYILFGALSISANEIIHRVYVPEKTGYSSRPSTHNLSLFIASETSLSGFMYFLTDEFTRQSFRQINVDFKTHNLVVYFHYEESDSIKFLLDEPIVLDNDTALYVRITHIVPPGQTLQSEDMQRYTIVYVVSKKILQITFESEKEKKVLIRGRD